jgi:hypothetical protein
MESFDSKKGFFKHVFTFDDDSKSEVLNIIQYSLLAFVPVVLLNKSIQRFVPDVDEEKGSIEILAEVVLQIVSLFLGIMFINRIITYVPTYSTMKYPDFSVTYFILPFLIITLSLQTKIGEKTSILWERFSELWNGKPVMNKNKKSPNPQQQQQQQMQQMQMQQMPSSQGTTSIDSLPDNSHNFNAMYKQENTPLVIASNPSNPYSSSGSGSLPMMNPSENVIMAANEFSSSAFGSSF